MIEVKMIQPKERKVFGKVYPGQASGIFNADIQPGKSIRIHGFTQTYSRINGHQLNPFPGAGCVSFDLTFNIGDQAEYDSFNLIYTGKIVSITAKTVTIEEYGQKHRLDLYTFIRRNYDFNLDKIRKYNAEEMLCI